MSVYRLAAKRQQVLAMMRDGVAVNGAAVRSLKPFMPAMIDVVCFSHTLDNVGSAFLSIVAKRNSDGRSKRAKLSSRSQTLGGGRDGKFISKFCYCLEMSSCSLTRLMTSHLRWWTVYKRFCKIKIDYAVLKQNLQP